MTIRRLIYYIRQVYGYIYFGKRVYVHGRFRVRNRKNLFLGDRCSINHEVYILAYNKIVIGDDVTLSARCMLVDSGLDLDNPGRRHIKDTIELKRGSWIGAGAIILPGVTVGEFSVVGAGSVVSRDVPPYFVVAGNPARVIKSLERVQQ